MDKGGSALVAPAYTGVTLLLSWIYLTFYAATAGIEAAAPISLMSVGLYDQRLVYDGHCARYSLHFLW